MNNVPVLCYINENWAYFTTQALDKQWGDDWGDAPYEHNAGTPYEYYPQSGGEPWEIVKVAFESRLEPPCSGFCNSEFSVMDINRGVVSWLKTPRWDIDSPVVHIWAGTPLDEFIKLIMASGGKVYTEYKEPTP